MVYKIDADEDRKYVEEFRRLPIGEHSPGLQRVLEGLSRGEVVHATVPPELAYGQVQERLLQVVPRERLPAVHGVEHEPAASGAEQQQQERAAPDEDPHARALAGRRPLWGGELR